MERFICIHAHCYQPPRENPWLETVERQDSAWPYHDWNERITAECYAPNCASRILDKENRIAEIVNNYSKISFNFGPTLLSWMEGNEPETYHCITASDAESQKRFSGHGSAIAQAYNHTILPLANSRDRYTQVKWGIRDFEKRFARFPEGMWLPETAVDIETLEILAQFGIKFTILAQSQAARTRKLGGRSWRDVSSLRNACKARSLMRGPGLNSCISPQTEKPTAIITVMETWPSLMDCIPSSRNLKSGSLTTASSWRNFRQRMRCKSLRTQHGVASTE